MNVCEVCGCTTDNIKPYFEPEAAIIMNQCALCRDNSDHYYEMQRIHRHDPDLIRDDALAEEHINRVER